MSALARGWARLADRIWWNVFLSLVSGLFAHWFWEAPGLGHYYAMQCIAEADLFMMVAVHIAWCRTESVGAALSRFTRG